MSTSPDTIAMPAEGEPILPTKQDGEGVSAPAPAEGDDAVSPPQPGSPAG